MSGMKNRACAYYKDELISLSYHANSENKMTVQRDPYETQPGINNSSRQPLLVGRIQQDSIHNVHGTYNAHYSACLKTDLH